MGPLRQSICNTNTRLTCEPAELLKHLTLLCWPCQLDWNGPESTSRASFVISSTRNSTAAISCIAERLEGAFFMLKKEVLQWYFASSFTHILILSHLAVKEKLLEQPKKKPRVFKDGLQLQASMPSPSFSGMLVQTQIICRYIYIYKYIYI